MLALRWLFGWHSGERVRTSTLLCWAFWGSSAIKRGLWKNDCTTWPKTEIKLIIGLRRRPTRRVTDYLPARKAHTHSNIYVGHYWPVIIPSGIRFLAFYVCNFYNYNPIILAYGGAKRYVVANFNCMKWGGAKHLAIYVLISREEWKSRVRCRISTNERPMEKKIGGRVFRFGTMSSISHFTWLWLRGQRYWALKMRWSMQIQSAELLLNFHVTLEFSIKSGSHNYYLEQHRDWH